ncbi:unnamed protein product [Linum trigynum]|uniref:Uncharacterized protein n=1 Tax=Linum trigynum TaxID=586398 RepID=A0AAV2EEW2_9ROSI
METSSFQQPNNAEEKKRNPSIHRQKNSILNKPAFGSSLLESSAYSIFSLLLLLPPPCLPPLHRPRSPPISIICGAPFSFVFIAACDIDCLLLELRFQEQVDLLPDETLLIGQIHPEIFLQLPPDDCGGESRVGAIIDLFLCCRRQEQICHHRYSESSLQIGGGWGFSRTQNPTTLIDEQEPSSFDLFFPWKKNKKTRHI